MKALAVYVGIAGQENFEHGIRAGIWGFKPNGVPRDSFGPGDWIVFGRGGDPRRPEEEWVRRPLAELAFARITSDLTHEEEPEWPNEKREGRTIYSERLRFDSPTRIAGPVNLADGTIPLDVALAIRNAGITNTGRVVPLAAPLGNGAASRSEETGTKAKPRSRAPRCKGSVIYSPSVNRGRKLHPKPGLQFRNEDTPSILRVAACEALRNSRRQFRHRKIKARAPLRRSGWGERC